MNEMRVNDSEMSSLWDKTTKLAQYRRKQSWDYRLWRKGSVKPMGFNLLKKEKLTDQKQVSLIQEWREKKRDV